MISEIISEILNDLRSISEILNDLGNYLLGSPFSAFVVHVRSTYVLFKSCFSVKYNACGIRYALSYYVRHVLTLYM